MPTDEELEAFERRIGHSFDRKDHHDLLKRALTHRSYPGDNNERLEFLGDAVLSQIVAYHYFIDSEEDESALTKKRSMLTDKVALAYVGQTIGIDRMLIFGDSIKGKITKNMVADAVEALIGAIYLDAGLEKATEVVERLFFNSEVLEKVSGRIDWITRLKEYADAHRQKPKYLSFEEIVEEVPTFIAWVTIDELTGQGVGGTKKEAMAKAAEDLMARLNQTG